MPHPPCLPNWGAEPTEISERLRVLNEQRPGGWAAQLDDKATYDALRALEDALFAAVGGARPDPVPYVGGPLPRENLRDLADATSGQLQPDRPFHGPLPWLRNPLVDPARVQDAESLYARVRNALDG